MSLAVNFSAHSRELTEAYQQVRTGDPNKEWAIFGYDKGTNDLKVLETGVGLDDLSEEFSDGKIQYAFVRVIEPTSGLPKLVLIGWCGSGVPVEKKGLFASHLNDVAAFLKGYHLQINARTENDVEPSFIMKRINESTGAKYTSLRETTTTTRVEQSKITSTSTYTPVTASVKTASVRSSSLIVENKPSAPARPSPINAPPVKKPVAVDSVTSELYARDEELRRQEERREQERQELEKKERELREARLQRNRNDTDRREAEIRSRLQRQENERQEQERREVELRAQRDRQAKERAEQERRESELRAQQDQMSKEAVERNKASQEAEQERLREQERAEEERQRKLREEEARKEAEIRAKKAREEAEKREQAEKARQKEEAERLAAQEEARKRAAAEKEEKERREQEEKARQEEEERRQKEAEAEAARQQQEKEAAEKRAREEKEKEEREKASKMEEYNALKNELHYQTGSSVTTTNGVSKERRAMALYDYEAMESDEMPLTEGEIVIITDKVDDDWWIGTGDGGKSGLFPATYVKLVTEEEEVEEEGKEVEKGNGIVDTSTAGQVAIAQFDYEGVENDELSFKEGDIINDIVMESADWWRGTAPNGKQGLFPASYVALDSA